MGDKTSDDPTFAFASALVAFATRHGKRGRGAQAWMIENSGKARSQVKYWFSAQDVPGQKAIRDFLRSFRGAEDPKDRPTIAEENHLRLAWQRALEAKWDAIDATRQKWPREAPGPIPEESADPAAAAPPAQALAEQVSALTGEQQLQLARLVYDMRLGGWAAVADLASRTARALAEAKGVGPLQVALAE